MVVVKTCLFCLTTIIPICHRYELKSPFMTINRFGDQDVFFLEFCSFFSILFMIYTGYRQIIIQALKKSYVRFVKHYIGMLVLANHSGIKKGFVSDLPSTIFAYLYVRVVLRMVVCRLCSFFRFLLPSVAFAQLGTNAKLA